MDHRLFSHSIIKNHCSLSKQENVRLVADLHHEGSVVQTSEEYSLELDLCQGARHLELWKT